VSAVERAVAWFVEPAVPVAAAPPAVRPGARAAVLGAAGRAEPVAAALALALRARERAGAAVVAVLGRGAGRPPGTASAAARRLAAQLDAHGLHAAARGRLAWASLPDELAQAIAATRRAAALGAPTVLAVTAPRSEPLDELLVEQDLLVVVTVDPEGPLATLATAGLEAVAPATVAVAPLAPGPRRFLALAGVSGGPLGGWLADALAAAPRTEPW
jgi:hypothetical protein